MEIHFSTIVRTMWKIYEGFTTLGRLYALKSLGTKQISHKTTINSQAQHCINAAAHIGQFMHKHYARKEPLVAWSSNLLPTINALFIHSSVTNMPLLDETIIELSSSLALALDNLHSRIKNVTALLPIIELINEVAIWLNLENKIAPDLFELLGERHSPNQGFIKILNGPMHVNIDAAFDPSYSVLKQPIPDFGDSLFDAVPYCWGLSARECLAADLCSLCLIEYDGLPIEFYVDMAKQSYDEIRHAAIFLEITKQLLPEFKSLLPKNHELYRAIETFQTTGSGLPIPLERNLYETMWNTTLEERFILMHHDTEAPGIQRIRSKLESEFCRAYPTIANQFEIVMREEVSHARIGDRWLKYLLPNPINRSNAIKHARLLRGILILTSSAHYCNTSLPVLIDNLISDNHICINA